MSAPEQKDDASREDAEYARYMRQHFGVETASTFPKDAGSEDSESSEDEMVAAYMRGYFPGAVE
jgi:hypothetical protein